ncbi:hypothetical protein PSEUDO8AS_50168 [Pseudomonas sp. 8AS]|nr:hypothetical protein PSEUDO8AS_50168 [Pseudomonas sp. 8AS]
MILDVRIELHGSLSGVGRSNSMRRL